MPHGVACIVWHACGIGVKRIVCHRCGMAREDLHFRLRLPEDLKRRVESAAADHRRSMTAEIVARLEASFDQELLLTGEGLAQVLKQASAVTTALWEMFVFQREVELDGFIADHAREGRVMTREQAIAFILREYLSERGYVSEPPAKRPGLAGLNDSGGPFGKFSDFLGTDPLYVDESKIATVWNAVNDAAHVAVQKKLAELEEVGDVRRERIAPRRRPGRRRLSGKAVSKK